MRLLELELGDDPDSSFTLFNIGLTLLDMQKPADALNPLARSLQLASRDDSHVRKLYALLTQAYSELGRTETALRTCLQGLAVCSTDPELIFRKGVLEQALRRFEDAERSFKQVIELQEPRRHFSSVDEGILGIKSWHNLAVVYESEAKHKLAATAWRRVLEYDRGNRTAWRGLLDALTHDKDAAGLFEIGDNLTDGEVPPEIRVLARARAMAESVPRDAVALLERNIDESNSTDLLEELCQIAFCNNLMDPAERWLRELVRRCPNDASAHQNLGMAYIRRHNYVKAAASAKRSLQLRPDYAPAKQLLDMATRMASSADVME